jgi:hypothetical protein
MRVVLSADVGGEHEEALGVLDDVKARDVGVAVHDDVGAEEAQVVGGIHRNVADAGRAPGTDLGEDGDLEAEGREPFGDHHEPLLGASHGLVRHRKREGVGDGVDEHDVVGKARIDACHGMAAHDVLPWCEKISR